MDIAISKFLEERKEKWLKPRLKSNLAEDEVQRLNEEADYNFSLNTWLPDAARRAQSIYFTSHTGKFSHPDSKISRINLQNTRMNNGLLYSGNMPAVKVDIAGNAAAIDVYKFLSLELEDGKTILEHLNWKTDYIKKELVTTLETFEETCQGLLSIQEEDVTQVTDGRVKQVYFPVENDYHLLSLLTPSGIIHELKTRIKKFQFSEETKAAKEAKKKQQHYEGGYNELLNLTMIGYGGAKPQNISVLNNQNGGEFYLLSSLPPILKRYNIRLPKKDFFKETIWASDYKESFQILHKILFTSRNNYKIRDGRDDCILYTLDQVMNKVWKIREKEAGGRWSDSKEYSALPLYQKILLDDFYLETRENQDDQDWMDRVIYQFVQWFVSSYKRVIGKQAIEFDDIDMRYVRLLIDKNKEALI